MKAPINMSFKWDIAKKKNFKKSLIITVNALKLASGTSLLVAFSCLEKSTCGTWKNVFFSLEKLFSFSRKSSLSILYIQISWRHQMPKHKTNTFYLITWEVNTIFDKIWPVYVIWQNKKIIVNHYKNCNWKLVPGAFLFAKN